MSYRNTLSESQFLYLLSQAQPGDVLSFVEHDMTGCNFGDGQVREQLVRISENNKAAKNSANLMIVDFSGANLHGRFLNQLYLTGFIFTDANCSHAVFEGSDLADVQMGDAALDQVDFRYCNMAYTKLHGASIIGANFAGADLSTTYGLCFNMPDADQKVPARLKVVSSIHRATLPKAIEPLRAEIEGS